MFWPHFYTMSPFIHKLQKESYELSLATRYHIETKSNISNDLKNQNYQNILEGTVQRKALTCVAVIVSTYVNFLLNQQTQNLASNIQDDFEKFKLPLEKSLNEIETASGSIYELARQLGWRIVRLIQ